MERLVLPYGLVWRKSAQKSIAVFPFEWAWWIVIYRGAVGQTQMGMQINSTHSRSRPPIWWSWIFKTKFNHFILYVTHGKALSMTICHWNLTDLGNFSEFFWQNISLCLLNHSFYSFYSSLVHLNLSYNQINNIEGLNQLWGSSYHLKTLELQGNRITSVEMLIQRLRGLSRLEELTLERDGSSNPLCQFYGMYWWSQCKNMNANERYSW